MLKPLIRPASCIRSTCLFKLPRRLDAILHVIASPTPLRTILILATTYTTPFANLPTTLHDWGLMSHHPATIGAEIGSLLALTATDARYEVLLQTSNEASTSEMVNTHAPATT